MSRRFSQRFLPLVFGLLACLTATLSAVPPEVSYDRETRKITVAADGQSLLEVLGQLAAHTGWQIFVEPEGNPRLHAQFQDVDVGQALELLVGGMNYAMVPQREGPTRLFIFRTSRGSATLHVPATEAKPATALIRRVGNELIVTVEPGTDIEALARRLGAKVIGQLDGTHTYRLQFEDEAGADAARTELASIPDVKRVENNYLVDRPPEPKALTRAPAAPPLKLTLNPPPADGRVLVGLVDTAVGSLGGDLDKFLIAGKSSKEAGGSVDGSLTHGTAMAYAIMSGMNAVSEGGTSAQVLWEDAYQGQESTTSWNLAQGTLAVINQGADLVVISSGGYGYSEILADVIRQASAKGIQVFVATGNDGLKILAHPAADAGATPVTATWGDQLAPYANFTPDVHLAGPGDLVVYQHQQAFGVSGTSPANAFVGGAAAGLAVSRDLSLTEAVKYLPRMFPVPRVSP